MTFSEIDKMKAMAIVRIFETGKAAGDYAALAVLDDGAGISYGVSQFTHRSGTLAAVVKKYLGTGSPVGRTALSESLPLLNKRTAPAIKQASADDRLKKALRAAAITSQMRQVQDETAEDLYLSPAISACEAMGITAPLSLAVIYDSMTHGSWEKIRDMVPFTITPQGVNLTQERLWITTYVRRRDAWLGSVKRLSVTRYRTQFFLSQIAISNWELKLPIIVHGVRLTCDAFPASDRDAARCPVITNLEAGPPQLPTENSTTALPTQNPPEPTTPEVRPPNKSETAGSETLQKIEQTIALAADKFDRVEAVIEQVITRTDSAKSLWATIGGTLWQMLWAIIGLFVGLPREVWFVVAVMAGVLMATYLYRQIVLGRIRELRRN